MKAQCIGLSASALLLLVSLNAWADSYPATDSHIMNSHIRILAATCGTCHGTNGNSAGGTPMLAGMDKSYFAAQMTAFKSGKRPSTVMQRHSMALTAEEIESLAQYFSAQKNRPASLPPSPAKG